MVKTLGDISVIGSQRLEEQKIGVNTAARKLAIPEREMFWRRPEHLWVDVACHAVDHRGVYFVVKLVNAKFAQQQRGPRVRVEANEPVVTLPQFSADHLAQDRKRRKPQSEIHRRPWRGPVSMITRQSHSFDLPTTESSKVNHFVVIRMVPPPGIEPGSTV